MAIGGSDQRSGFAIAQLAGATLVSDYLAIADAGFSEIRFYSLSGELSSRSGQPGSGPGEYEALRGLEYYNDSTVVAWDVQLKRLTLVSVDGDVRATVSPDLRAAERMSPSFVGVSDGGRFVFRDGTFIGSLRDERAGERRDSIRYMVLEPTGDWGGVGWKEIGPEVYFSNHGFYQNRTSVIFGRSALESSRAGGLIVGATDSLLVKYRNVDGSIRHEARLPSVAIQVKDAWVETERERLRREETESMQRSLESFSFSSPADPIELLEEDISQSPSRSTLPAFSAIRVDADGNTWIAEYPPPGALQRKWIVLDSDFRPIAGIEIPTAIEILDIGTDYLVGATKDEFDRERVALYPVLR